MAPSCAVRNDAEDVPYSPICHRPWPLFWPRSRAQSQQSLPSISRARGRERAHAPAPRAPRQLPPHVIWLDATANAPLYETLFGRPVTVVRPEDVQGRVRQVWAGLNNKQALSGQAPKTDHLRQQIDRCILRGYARPAFIGYKDLIRGLRAEGITPDWFAHLAAAAARTACKIATPIVIGAPQPPIQLLDMAAMLYHERDEPFTATWSTRDIPVRRTGVGLADWRLLGRCAAAGADRADARERTHSKPFTAPGRSSVTWTCGCSPMCRCPISRWNSSAHTSCSTRRWGWTPTAWPEVVATAQARMDAAGMVTTADLVDAKLCAAPSAKNIDALAQTQGWMLTKAPASGRGQTAGRMCKE